MERLEQVMALVVTAGLAIVSYQLFSPARRDLRRPEPQPPLSALPEEVAPRRSSEARADWS